MPALLGLAGLISGCKEDDDLKPQMQQHDTVYTFAKGVWDNLYISDYEPNDRIAASADSAEVRYVLLRSGLNSYGFLSWDGFPNTYIQTRLSRIVESVPEKNRHKLRGDGIINFSTNDSDEAHNWLSDFGFTLENEFLR
ncbi:MAG: hypothetical protein J1E02_06665 [Coprobacter sp.]|nr:hypothetical protein [Coprobacter sp.]